MHESGLILTLTGSLAAALCLGFLTHRLRVIVKNIVVLTVDHSAQLPAKLEGPVPHRFPRAPAATMTPVTMNDLDRP